MRLEKKLRLIAAENAGISETLNKAADRIEELKEDKRYLKIRLSQNDVIMEKFVDPNNLRAYLMYADSFEEYGPYKTLGYEQWFKREYK